MKTTSKSQKVQKSSSQDRKKPIVSTTQLQTKSQNNQKLTVTQKKLTPPITNPKPKPPVISDRVKKGSEDPILHNNKFGALMDDGAMDTDESTGRSGARNSFKVTSHCSKVEFSSLYHFSFRSSTYQTLLTT